MIKKKNSKGSKCKIENYDSIEDIFNRECSEYDSTYHPLSFPPVPKIIVFGDIHGDLELAIELLEAAKLVDYDGKNYNWIGKDTWVVQVGDQVDRCRPIPGYQCNDINATKNDEHSDIIIMELFNSLDKQAREVGGRVISLLGNHEILNVTGFMNYVSYKGIKGFEQVDSDTGKVIKNGMTARIEAFDPKNKKNKYAKMMGCTRYPAVIIGSNIFVHAGIVDALINDMNIQTIDDLEKINIKLRLWLLGIMDESCVSDIIDNRDKYSMFWTRILGSIPPGTPIDHPQCAINLKKALKIFHMVDDHGNVRMMIGHTPQSFIYSDDINATCSNKIWRVDNGSSKAFDSFDSAMKINNEKDYSRRPQYLLILNDNEYFVCDKDECKEESQLSTNYKIRS